MILETLTEIFRGLWLRWTCEPVQVDLIERRGREALLRSREPLTAGRTRIRFSWNGQVFVLPAEISTKAGEFLYRAYLLEGLVVPQKRPSERSERVPCSLTAESPMLVKGLAQVKDLSSGGFKMALGQPVPLEQELTLLLKSGLYGQRHYLTATAVWCRAVGPSRFEAGFRFCRLGEDDRRWVRRRLNEAIG